MTKVETIGIYSITNKINGKIYFGQSHHIEHRFDAHKWREANKHLKSSYKKYGLENFEFAIVKVLHDSPTLSQLLLDAYEDHYIQKYHTTDPKFGYNKKGGGAYGRHSEETNEKCRQAMLGKKASEETRIKLSIAHKGKPGHLSTEESRAKLRIARAGRIFTDETRKKLSTSLKGVNTWSKGRPWSEKRRAAYNKSKGIIV